MISLKQGINSSNVCIVFKVFPKLVENFQTMLIMAKMTFKRRMNSVVTCVTHFVTVSTRLKSSFYVLKKREKNGLAISNGNASPNEYVN